MEDSPDFLKNNEHYLKSFILNDVLQKEPIFNSYRKLCKLVGQDAIEYPDFEFWFYRFYHGNRDFVYDRSADPKPKSLMDMPVKLMCKIAGNLDQFERTRLRTMNHAIKDVIDSCPPVFEGIFISVSYEKLEWYSNKKKFICKPDGNGCTFSKPNRVHLEKSDKNFIKMGLEHLTPIFKISNIQVNHLSIMVWTETRGLENLLPASCHVKDALIYGCYMDLIIQFLLAMKPRHLESFTIWGCLDLIEKEDCKVIFESDQFKYAKRVTFFCYVKFNVEDLVNFSHLKFFECQMNNDIGRYEILRLRDIVSTFEQLELCHLKFRSIGDIFPMGRFAEALGERIPIGPLKECEHVTITHRYKIPKSNECLEFKITNEGEWCCVNIVKSR
ncbi:hypothetical protein B9Z55_026948 [Caenorhabditis nigoni]|uniref:F-box domain-containing protein n=1 Tax=Caenorhabditis nigoni TaxID=1611254 RepID=A0A2G5SI75_9PELO|nr:hypothetical protein B9Z55_026948 [Caenorhabditis nigoni]